jgi:hypothetical protein
MATLYITEFSRTTVTGVTGPATQIATPAPLVPPVAEQAISLSGTSAQCAAFQNDTTLVMISTDAPCCLAWGTDPTATLSAQRMAANETRFYGIPKGETMKLAAISTT